MSELPKGLIVEGEKPTRRAYVEMRDGSRRLIAVEGGSIQKVSDPAT